MKQWGYRVITAVLLVGWMSIIFSFSAQPATESSEISGNVAYRILDATDQIFQMELSKGQLAQYAEKLDYPIRKAAHMTEYAIMGWLAFAFLCGYINKEKYRYLLGWGMTIVYATTDEIHQLFVPGRSGQISDVCIDGIGAAIGLAILCLC